MYTEDLGYGPAAAAAAAVASTAGPQGGPCGGGLAPHKGGGSVDVIGRLIAVFGSLDVFIQEYRCGVMQAARTFRAKSCPPIPASPCTMNSFPLIQKTFLFDGIGFRSTHPTPDWFALPGRSWARSCWHALTTTARGPSAPWSYSSCASGSRPCTPARSVAMTMCRGQHCLWQGYCAGNKRQ